MILEHLPSILRYNRLFRVQSLFRGEIYVEGERVIRKIRNTMFCDKKSDSMGEKLVYKYHQFIEGNREDIYVLCLNKFQIKVSCIFKFCLGNFRDLKFDEILS